MSSGFGDGLQAVPVVCSLERWSPGDAIGVSRVLEPGVSGCCFRVVVLGPRSLASLGRPGTRLIMKVNRLRQNNTRNY